MPLDTNNPYYVAEITPPAIAAMERPLCAAFGVGLYAFGAKGNTVHLSGYHRSRQWIIGSPDSRYGGDDYSVRQTLDQGGDQRWVSAFDFTPGDWGTAENRRRMIAITGRVHAAAKARDPRLSSLREFAGTLDGRNVVTFNCADGSLKSPFDSSHLDHVHGSFWRARADHDHSGIVSVMLGAPGGFLMALTDQQQTDLWEWLALLVDPTTPPTGRPSDRFHFPPLVMQAAKLVPVLQTQVTALTATVQALADAVNSAGGNVDTAAIFAKIDEATAAVKVEVDEATAAAVAAGQEARDAVGDLGEGGAAQVREDAPGAIHIDFDSPSNITVTS